MVIGDPNGLLYMRARYYNPFLCRFLNPDPSGFSGGLNLYAYGNGNPISDTDPSGLCGSKLDAVSTSLSWLAGDASAPRDLFNPFSLNTSEQPSSTGQLTGNGLNNTVSAIGTSMGQGLYDLYNGARSLVGLGTEPGYSWQQSQRQYNQIYDQMYSVSTPENPAATPYIETSLGVSAGAVSIAGFAGTWEAAGLPTMNVAVGPGTPAFSHVVYGTGETWVGATGSIGAQTVAAGQAGIYANAFSWFTVTGIPVVNSAAVTATGGSALTCVTAAASAFLRGWLP